MLPDGRTLSVPLLPLREMSANELPSVSSNFR
jgi:hypothetical protein